MNENDKKRPRMKIKLELRFFICQKREMLLAWAASNLSPHMWLLLLLQATKEDIWGGHCPSEGHKISPKMSFFNWAEENVDPLQYVDSFLVSEAIC